ncbi:SDR family NAD(P)-dependent oxidoreductase [Hansschlegelia quercus]|uniref:SDR family oxidoreductase n=1 Tax=Hansschlegelia quercus TaxID=2528245 RepID=A0A4Q9G9M3_9HYPH|nr:SDR family oxidoreductase [Hansschlegelia quercus]TBN47591.1 SDR family oxidoreductase [Hansschlegelia quercus]
MVSPHQGLRVVVTGASSGIGRAGAMRLTEEGARVVGLDIAPISSAFPMVACDLADEAQVVSAMAEASKTLGGLDAVVSSAGLDLESPLERFDLAAFDRMVAVNVRGVILIAREALKHFGEDGGRIVNIASELGYLGRAGASGYCATKGAILALTRSWARELAPKVLVNAVAPGPIDTPLLNFAAMTPEQQALETLNPMRRIGRAEEVAEAILFLTSRRTTFTTGQCVSVDGGAAMH